MTVENVTGRTHSPTMSFYSANINGTSFSTSTYSTSPYSNYLLFDALNDYNPGVKFKLKVWWKNSGTNTNSLILRDISTGTNIAASEISETMSSSNVLQINESEEFEITNGDVRPYGYQCKASSGTASIRCVQLMVIQAGSIKGTLASYNVTLLNESVIVPYYGLLAVNWTDMLIDIDKFPPGTKARYTVYWKNASATPTNYIRIFDQFSGSGAGDNKGTEVNSSEMSVIMDAADTLQIDRIETPFELNSGLTSYMIQLKVSSNTMTVHSIQMDLIIP